MKLLKRILMFMSPILILLLILNFSATPVLKNNDAIFMASVDKERRISEIQERKIILSGVSSLAFGINSKEIEQQTNRRTINMGLSSECGLTFILNETLPFVKDGDIVVLSPGYFLSDGVKRTQSFLLDNNPMADKYLPHSFNDDLMYTVCRFQRIASSLFYLRAKKRPVYSRSAFNERGDIMPNYDSTSTYKGETILLAAKNYSKEIEEINAFVVACRRKNVSVYYSYPPNSYSQYNANKEVMKTFDSTLRKNLKCAVLDSIDTYVYPDKYFFDNCAHLNQSGGEMRTKAMIRKLKNVMQ